MVKTEQLHFVQGMGKIYHAGYDDEVSWSVPWQTPKAPNYSKLRSAPVKDEDKPNAKDGPAFESADVADNFYKDGMTADLAVKTLQGLKSKTEPFFLAVGFSKPHLPFVAPKKYWDLYDPASIKLAPNPYHPEDSPEYALTSSGELRNFQGMPATGAISDELARTLKHGYYASISYTEIGRASCRERV
jgi:arylsulfatase A-like enzyme